MSTTHTNLTTTDGHFHCEVPKVGDRVEIRSGMGGTFPVKVIARDLPVLAFTGRVDMPKNPDWDGVERCFGLDDIVTGCGTDGDGSGGGFG